MAVDCGGASPVPSSLPPPRPKSPPQYPDLYGKRRELARVQMLEREIGFLQEELKFFDGLPPASQPCKEVADFVMPKADPLVVTAKKKRRRCRFWKWFCGLSCFKISCLSCCCWCSPSCKMPTCCRDCNCSRCVCSPSCGDCNNCSGCMCSPCCKMPSCGGDCNCSGCQSCCRCSVPKCNCCSLQCCKCSLHCCKCFETCKCFQTWKCSLSCCIPKCLSCSDCTCKRCSCSSCFRCPKVKFSCSCTKNCCYPCFCLF